MGMNINEDKNGLIWGKWKMNERTWVLTNRWCNFCYLSLGDEVEAGQALMVLNDTLPLEERVQKHLEVMEELITRANEYDIICPAHNGICISKDYINDFRELDRNILNNTVKLQESVVGFNWTAKVDKDSDIAACYPASRAQYGKASIVYR